MSGEAPQPSNALKRWELENNVQEASASDMDALYRYDAAEQKAIQEARPWKNDPHYFKRCGARRRRARGRPPPPLSWMRPTVLRPAPPAGCEYPRWRC